MSVIHSAETSQPRGNVVDSRDYWETKTLKYDCLHDRIRRIIDRVDQMEPRTLLDVGCSTGELARAVGARLPDVTYYGCDISGLAVQRNDSDNVVQCDINAERLPFADRSFDCVIASGICEYVDDLPRFLDQLADRLAARGTLLVTYVNAHHISRLGRMLLGRKPVSNPTWRRLVSLKSFERLLEASGLAIVDQEITSGRIKNTDHHSRSYRNGEDGPLPSRGWSLPRWLARQIIFVCHKKH